MNRNNKLKPNYAAWSDATSSGGSDLQTLIEKACRFAILAPSVHNTQPWQLYLSGNSLTLAIAGARVLDAGDPTKRETWLSIGAFSENLTIACRALGLSIKSGARSQDSLVFEFGTAIAEPGESDLLSAMIERRSNRHPFAQQPIPAEVAKEIRNASSSDTRVVLTSDRDLIDLMANLTRRAITIALGSPEFRTELSTLIRPSNTAAETGMPGFTLGVSKPRSFVEAGLVRSGHFATAQAKKEYEAMLASAAVILVFSGGDSQPYWTKAGRAYQHAALVATKYGLATSTTAAVVEAADFHNDVERALGETGRLQSVMRIGYALKEVGHSPRIPLEKLITYSS